MEIGKIIKELRKGKGLSQKALGEKIGVSQKAINYWELGVNEPKASYVVMLADYFGVTADYLLGRKEY